jgi:hypothetical protein
LLKNSARGPSHKDGQELKNSARKQAQRWSRVWEQCQRINTKGVKNWEHKRTCTKRVKSWKATQDEAQELKNNKLIQVLRA